MNMVGQLRAGRLAGSQRLDLSCGLTEFPREIFDLADTLEVLNLSGNALSTLPDDLHRLHRLRVLFCSDNQFSRLPESIGRCPQLDMVGFKANRVREVPAASLPPSLRWLILTDNLIDELPSALGQCTRLQKLMLAGNRLRALPETLAHCRSLELLRISANELDALPSWLLSMPRLAWLAFSGNPFDETPEQAALARPAAATVDWQRLTLKQKLGEGASGVIHEADWRLNDGSLRQVAVKLFKGAVTSDGWPHSEMAACIAAGVHPSLIGVLGRVENHPEGTPALVLERVNARCRNLAGAPSLQSCTRDVYGADARWSVDVALSMAGGIASATAQLHARGILHGDLYAHNILSDGRGDCLLGDFGAASFLPVDDDERSRALQRIEARAFGCLLEELLAHCDPVEASGGAGRKLLARLQERCIDPDVSARPSFDELASLLSAPSAR